MKSNRGAKKTLGFTLIELLIVIAIIAILALIAVPNFLEAQTRAKVSRVLADYKAFQIAMESYQIDYSMYPPDQFTAAAGDAESFNRLTTPMAYMTSVPVSPFRASDNPYNSGDEYKASLYNYGANKRFTSGGGTRDGWPPAMVAAGIRYWIDCAGPDNEYTLNDFPAWGDGQVWIQLDEGSNYLEILYEPSNGTVSRGDILMSNKRIYNGSR